MTVEVRDLELTLSDFELKIPLWQMSAGEHLLIQGPSGAGKTTFLHLLAGLILPTRGQIKVGSTTLSEMSAFKRTSFRKKNCGIIFQKIHLLPHLTLLENVLLGNNSSYRTAADLSALLDHLRLEHRKNHLPTEVSLGEAQRAAIARALASEPKIILADEPTSGLDDANAEVVMRLLTTKMRGKTLLVVSHDHRVRDYFSKSLNFMEITKS